MSSGQEEDGHAHSYETQHSLVRTTTRIESSGHSNGWAGQSHDTRSQSVVVPGRGSSQTPGESAVGSQTEQYAFKKIQLIIVHGFRPESDNFELGKTGYHCTSQEEQNGTNFSFVAPSSEEL